MKVAAFTRVKMTPSHIGVTMFKKTVSDLKELKNTNHDVNVKIAVDAVEICKPVAKMVAVLAVINVATHVAIKAVDAKFPESNVPTN